MSNVELKARRNNNCCCMPGRVFSLLESYTFMTEDLNTKLSTIKMLAMDVDGVLTSGEAIYGSDGFEAVAFNVRDGASIKWLQRYGLETALITGRTVGAVKKRAEDLGIPYVYQGAKVKIDAYNHLKNEAQLDDPDICYIGDDLTDIPVLRHAGMSATVANAPQEVKNVSDLVTDATSGNGAVRQIAEMLLKTQGHWSKLMDRYYRD